MFMYLQKNKKGFTLIELMVVVAIIGILALLGLRLYSGQQSKAKEAIVKANASTVHTLIQSALADGPVNLGDYNATLVDAGLRNPFTGVAMATGDFITGEKDATPTGTEGQIYINVQETVTIPGGTTEEPKSGGIEFKITGIGEKGPIPETLTAKR